MELMHAWYSADQAALCGTITYRLSVTGEEVVCSEISMTSDPRGWADARWLGVIDASEVVRYDEARARYNAYRYSELRAGRIYISHDYAFE